MSHHHLLLAVWQLVYQTSDSVTSFHVPIPYQLSKHTLPAWSDLFAIANSLLW